MTSLVDNELKGLEYRLRSKVVYSWRKVEATILDIEDRELDAGTDTKELRESLLRTLQAIDSVESALFKLATSTT